MFFSYNANAFPFSWFQGWIEDKDKKCPKISKETPKCPNGSSRILDDTYPVKALVISNSPYKTTNNSYQTPPKFIYEAIKAYGADNIKDIPKIIIPCRKVCFDQIISTLENELRLKKFSNKQINKIIGKIHHADASAYTWQQDYFESFYDPYTGSPFTREFESYSVNVDYQSLTKTAEKIGCDINSNQGFKPHPKSFGNGEMGGNLEGLPAGGCLYGNNLDSDLVKEICAKPEDHAQVITGFLEVGHVDEIFKVTPRKTKAGEPKECGFTINYASPRLALDLMEKNPGDLLYNNIPPAPREVDFLDNRLIKLCSIIKKNKEAIKTQQPNPNNSPSSSPSIKVKGTFYNIFNFNAYAGLSVANSVSGKPTKALCTQDDLKRFTNQDFVNGLKYDKDLYQYNLDIDDLMQENLQVVTDNILKRLPQCKNHLDLLPVPDIYKSFRPASNYITKNGKKVLRKKAGDALSFFPSPTNGVFLNKTNIYSDPEIPAFKKYLKKKMQDRDNLARFIPTYEYSHLGQGNLHCSSHTLPYCRP